MRYVTAYPADDETGEREWPGGWICYDCGVEIENEPPHDD